MSGYKFKSGAWDGYYTMQGKQKSVSLQLNFTTGEVKGNGSDDYLGYFEVGGTYVEKPPYSCNLTLTYSMVPQTIEFTGWRESERGGIFGNWKGVGGSGSFAFAPSKEQPQQSKATAVSKTGLGVNKDSITQLANMGFPQWMCEAALETTGDMDAAVDYCFNLMQTTNTDTSQEGQRETPEHNESNEELIEQLVVLGFSQEQALSASRRTSNVEAAVEIILSGE